MALDPPDPFELGFIFYNQSAWNEIIEWAMKRLNDSRLQLDGEVPPGAPSDATQSWESEGVIDVNQSTIYYASLEGNGNILQWRSGLAQDFGISLSGTPYRLCDIFTTSTTTTSSTTTS